MSGSSSFRFALLCYSVVVSTAPTAHAESVPDLTGLLASQAEAQLSRLGLTPVFELETSPMRRNSVLRHVPGAGGTAGEENLIVVWLSDGLELPDGIIGQAPDVARAQLEQMGATVQLTTRDQVNVTSKGVIEVVGISPGDKFDATQDVVTLVVPNEVGVRIPSLVGGGPALRALLEPLDLTLNYLNTMGPPPNQRLEPCYGWDIADAQRSVSPREGTIVQRGTVVQVTDSGRWVITRQMNIGCERLEEIPDIR